MPTIFFITYDAGIINRYISMDPDRSYSMRFFIEEAKCDASEFAKEIGLIPGAVVASVRYNNGQETKWLHCLDFQSILMFFSTEEDCFDILLNDDITKEEIDYMEQYQITSFHGVEVPEYVPHESSELDCFHHIELDPENKPINGLFCYILAMLMCSYEDTAECVSLGIGNYSDELDIEKLYSFINDE